MLLPFITMAAIWGISPTITLGFLSPTPLVRAWFVFLADFHTVPLAAIGLFSLALGAPHCMKRAAKTESSPGLGTMRFCPLAAIGLFSVPLASTVFYSSCDQVVSSKSTNETLRIAFGNRRRIPKQELVRITRISETGGLWSGMDSAKFFLMIAAFAAAAGVATAFFIRSLKPILK